MRRYWRREQIEDVAIVTLLDYRRRTGERLAPPIDIDLVGELACGLQWDWEVIVEPPGTLIWAALFPHEARAVLNETHAARFAANSGFERFTKAHEIGHWMLHVDKERGEYEAEAAEAMQSREYIQVPQYKVRGSLPATMARDGETNWLERHADWFAAALLMPASVFVPMAEAIDVNDPRQQSQLARTFDVSLTALRARLSHLGFIAPKKVASA